MRQYHRAGNAFISFSALPAQHPPDKARDHAVMLASAVKASLQN
ncbi:hypothetical protein [Klebsiella phage Kpn74]|uniref:Uncharacterized protein n=1 Tax=Klebsiella phage Kpn74 TaxID=3044026 RepID=A0AAT9V622_9CAUD|nr:hypothetical protein [Klebsiella phage Kpn74]